MRRIQDAQELAAAIDRMHRTLHDFPDPAQVARSFADVDAAWHHLREMLEQRGASPAVLRAAGHVAQIDHQLHQALNLDPAPPVAVVPALPPPGPPRSRVVRRPPFGNLAPVLSLSDQLVGQIDVFLQGFAPNADVVPQGERMLDDAQRLRAAALEFRREVRSGAPPDQLAAELQAVEQWWDRLARRIDRVSRGRTGPNIEAAMQIGDITREIRGTLGALARPSGAVPGYAPPAADPDPYGPLPRPPYGPPLPPPR